MDVSAWLKAPLHGAQTVSQGIYARRARSRLVIALRPTQALITIMGPTRSHVGVLTRRWGEIGIPCPVRTRRADGRRLERLLPHERPLRSVVGVTRG